MGEYADDAIERDLSYHIDEFQENTNELFETDNSFIKSDEYISYEFNRVKSETSKSWLLIMNGGHELRLPKSQCEIKDNIVLIPRWLVNKIINFNPNTK